MVYVETSVDTVVSFVTILISTLIMKLTLKYVLKTNTSLIYKKYSIRVHGSVPTFDISDLLLLLEITEYK